MPRSGSTWSFNVVKQLLSRASTSVRGGYTDSIGEALAIHGEKAEHVIVKSHGPDAVGRALIKQRLCRTVYTYREPLDCVLSAMEAFHNEFDQMVDAAKKSLELMRFQTEAGGVLLVWYDDLMGATEDVVQRIADYLELALPRDAVAEVAAMLNRDNVRRFIKALGKSAAQVPGNGAQWDGSTLFSNHHVREHPSNPTQVFSAAQIGLMADRLSDYVDAAAALHPEIRALGVLSADGTAARSWPTPPESAPTSEPPEAPEAPAAEAIVETSAAPAASIAAETTATVPAAPLATAVAPDAPSAVDAEPSAPDAPLAADAEPSAPDAPLAADAEPAAPSPQPAAAPPPTIPATIPAAAAASKPAAAPRAHGFDPVRDAARRALARDLLGTLRPQTTGKRPSR